MGIPGIGGVPGVGGIPGVGGGAGGGIEGLAGLATGGTFNIASLLTKDPASILGMGKEQVTQAGADVTGAVSNIANQLGLGGVVGNLPQDAGNEAMRLLTTPLNQTLGIPTPGAAA